MRETDRTAAWRRGYLKTAEKFLLALGLSWQGGTETRCLGQSPKHPAICSRAKYRTDGNV